MPMGHIFNFGLHRSAIFFYSISLATQYSKKNVIEYIKHVLWFCPQLLSETFVIPRRISRDMIKKCIWLHVKYKISLSDVNKVWIFSTDFRKIFMFHENSSNVIRVVHADRRTDITNILVAFRNFSYNPYKNISQLRVVNNSSSSIKANSYKSVGKFDILLTVSQSVSQ
jgi:hypothetical protein